jgi:hypothetical protein
MRRAIAWRATVRVPVSPERAWALWSRVEDWPRWEWLGSADARWLRGEPWTPGARLRVGHRPGTFECVVTRADPPREVEWEGRGLWLHGRHRFRFLPHPEGTLVETTETFTGFGVPLLRPLIRWFWRRQLRSLGEWIARSEDR